MPFTGHRFLFRFHEEQNEDGPHANRYWKLNQNCISHRAPPWKRKRKSQHSQSREYPEGQSGFGVHRPSTSLIRDEHHSRKTGKVQLLLPYESQIALVANSVREVGFPFLQRGNCTPQVPFVICYSLPPRTILG